MGLTLNLWKAASWLENTETGNEKSLGHLHARLALHGFTPVLDAGQETPG